MPNLCFNSLINLLRRVEIEDDNKNEHGPYQIRIKIQPVHTRGAAVRRQVAEQVS